jgi:3-oxoacyl-[acyl-carrier protein] reductase
MEKTQMDLGIEGRRAAVAGSSAGLGLNTARALVEAGVLVTICGRDKSRVQAAADDLGKLATPIVADVSTPDGATAFVDESRSVLGGIDILVPNAGGPPPGGFAQTALEAYLPALELNLLSTVAMCKSAIPDMCEQGWGRVVAITSISVRQPIGTLILSNTARAGVTGFLKTVATEVASQGVTVNSVQPGVHLTDRLSQLNSGAMRDFARGIPSGELGDPRDFGHVAAFLCSEHARFITGAAIPVDGGQAMGLQ